MFSIGPPRRSAFQAVAAVVVLGCRSAQASFCSSARRHFFFFADRLPPSPVVLHGGTSFAADPSPRSDTRPSIPSTHFLRRNSTQPTSLSFDSAVRGVRIAAVLCLWSAHVDRAEQRAAPGGRNGVWQSSAYATHSGRGFATASRPQGEVPPTRFVARPPNGLQADRAAVELPQAVSIVSAHRPAAVVPPVSRRTWSRGSPFSE